MKQEAFCQLKGVSVAKLKHYRKKIGMIGALPRKNFAEIKLITKAEKSQISIKRDSPYFTEWDSV